LRLSIPCYYTSRGTPESSGSNLNDIVIATVNAEGGKHGYAFFKFKIKPYALLIARSSKDASWNSKLKEQGRGGKTKRTKKRQVKKKRN
jgi:hypothetical protein